MRLGNLPYRVLCLPVVDIYHTRYGDLHPVEITKAFAVIEAFTGVFINFICFTMGRKMMR
jgi:hypothetical protein